MTHELVFISSCYWKSNVFVNELSNLVIKSEYFNSNSAQVIGQGVAAKESKAIGFTVTPSSHLLQNV